VFSNKTFAKLLFNNRNNNAFGRARDYVFAVNTNFEATNAYKNERTQENLSGNK
jgi:hypothetical protein